MKKTLPRGSRMPKPDVFERMLADVSTPDIIGSIYYTGRLIQRRKDLLDVYQGFRVPNVASEPSDQEQDIAFRLLRRIELEEKTPVHDLSDQQARKYLQRLDKIVWERIRARNGFDPERGERLLAGLRERYNGAPA